MTPHVYHRVRRALVAARDMLTDAEDTPLHRSYAVTVDQLTRALDDLRSHKQSIVRHE